LHRVILGSIERFLGVLTEHYAGAFPVWLAPVQAIILPITDQQNDFAQQVCQKLIEHDIRTELDTRHESLSHKIREAQTQKIPFMLVIGQQEVNAGTVAPRLRSGKNIGQYTVDELITHINNTCRQELLPSKSKDGRCVI